MTLAAAEAFVTKPSNPKLRNNFKMSIDPYNVACIIPTSIDSLNDSDDITIVDNLWASDTLFLARILFYRPDCYRSFFLNRYSYTHDH